MTRLGRPPPLSSPPRRLRAQLGAAGVGWPPGSPAFCGASAGLFGSREPVSWVGGRAAQRKETSHHLSEHRQARRATEGQSTPLLARSSDSRPGLARKAPCEPSWSDPWPQCPPTKPGGGSVSISGPLRARMFSRAWHCLTSHQRGTPGRCLTLGPQSVVGLVWGAAQLDERGSGSGPLSPVLARVQEPRGGKHGEAEGPRLARLAP